MGRAEAIARKKKPSVSTRPARARVFADAPSSYADASRLTSHDGAVALRVDSGSERERLRLSPAEPALVLTLPGTVAVGVRGATRSLDRATWVVLPAGAVATLTIESPTARVVVLELSRQARERALAEHGRDGMDADALVDVLAKLRVLPRTTWVDELAHRYLFERGICRKHRSAAAVFLETELTKEAYFLTVEGESARERAPLSVGRSAIVARALDVIDASLGRALGMRELARRAGASTRTLERAFSRELGLTPSEHLRKKRLDEARVLLRSGRLGVGEVAARVGYRSLPAFSTAYREQFGHPPSDDRAW